MAVLPNQDRVALSADFQRTFESGETIGATKQEVRDLLDDLDDYLDANATAINQAIRVGIRSKFTARQKARALTWVIRKRFEVT